MFVIENTDARVFFQPLSILPRPKRVCENVNAWALPRGAINLPSYREILSEQPDSVAGTISDLVGVWS
jgi:perosamine synthetase